MLIQLIGFIGFIFLGISNISKKRKNIILFQTMSCLFFSVHYFFINALTAAILNIFGIARGLTFYNKKEGKKIYNYFLVFYLLIYLLVGIFTYDGIVSIFPIIAYILYTISVYVEKEIKMKIICFLVSTMWLIYDISYKSYAGILSDFVMLVTVIIGIFLLIKNDKVLKK